MNSYSLHDLLERLDDQAVIYLNVPVKKFWDQNLESNFWDVLNQVFDVGKINKPRVDQFCKNLLFFIVILSRKSHMLLDYSLVDLLHNFRAIFIVFVVCGYKHQVIQISHILEEFMKVELAGVLCEFRIKKVLYNVVKPRNEDNRR